MAKSSETNRRVDRLVPVALSRTIELPGRPSSNARPYEVWGKSAPVRPGDAERLEKPLGAAVHYQGPVDFCGWVRVGMDKSLEQFPFRVLPDAPSTLPTEPVTGCAFTPFAVWIAEDGDFEIGFAWMPKWQPDWTGSQVDTPQKTIGYIYRAEISGEAPKKRGRKMQFSGRGAPEYRLRVHDPDLLADLKRLGPDWVSEALAKAVKREADLKRLGPDWVSEALAKAVKREARKSAAS